MPGCCGNLVRKPEYCQNLLHMPGCWPSYCACVSIARTTTTTTYTSYGQTYCACLYSILPGASVHAWILPGATAHALVLPELLPLRTSDIARPNVPGYCPELLRMP
jgi:hypothetical protein